MKILVIASNVSKTPAGTAYPFIFDEIYRLVKRGIELHVVRSRVEDDEYSYNIYFHGLGKDLDINMFFSYIQKLFRISPMGLLRSPKVIYLEGKYYSKLIEIVEKFKIDIIHAHFAYPEGVVGLSVKAMTGRLLVVTTHGYDLQLVPEIRYGARLSPRIDHLVRKVINDADVVIVPSRRMYKIAVDLVNDPQKIHLIHNGVDINMFNPNIERSLIRKVLKIKEDEILILAARNLYPVYGIEYLIKAIPEVIKHYEKIKVLIVGEGPMRCYLYQLSQKMSVDETVIFVGRVPRTLMPLYLAAADICCLPSLMEGLPIFLLESLASGKPIVATRVGGIPEAVINGYNGYLVKPKDPQSLASALLELILSPTKMRAFGQNSRRIAEEKFNIEKRIDKLINVYYNIMR